MKQIKRNIIYIVFFAIICVFIALTIQYYFRAKTSLEGLRSKKKKKKSSKPVETEEKTDLTSNAADAASKNTEEKIPTTFDPKFLYEMSPENIVKTIVKQLYDIRNLTNKINDINVKPK